jgi:hypothetical protein
MDDFNSIGSENFSSIDIFICGALKTPTVFAPTTNKML